MVLDEIVLDVYVCHRDNVRVNLSYCKYESLRTVVENLGFVEVDDEVMLFQ